MSTLEAFLTAHEAGLRSAAFFGLLVGLGVLEHLRPRRHQSPSLSHKGGNLTLGILNIILLRVLVPGGLVGLALWQNGGGLMGVLHLPQAVEFFLCLLLLDLTLYWQHRLLHEMDFLWRWHAPHHGDRDLNVTSAVRFHPGEALISIAIKAASILALGAPVAAIILFEILLSSASLFTHTNWSLGRVDKWLRLMIVTPDMHRLHHSRVAQEARKNFGFFLSLWDRLFGSYQAEPKSAHETLPLGIEAQSDDGLWASLVYPFRRY